MQQETMNPDFLVMQTYPAWSAGWSLPATVVGMKTSRIAGTVVKTHTTACRGKHGHGLIEDNILGGTEENYENNWSIS